MTAAVQRQRDGQTDGRTNKQINAVSVARLAQHDNAVS